MSWALFRSEINALTGMQHVSRIQFAQVIGKAYNGLVGRTTEQLTAGGRVIAYQAGLPSLIRGIYSTTEMNLGQHKMVNFFTQISPYIYSYWAGKTIIGPTGIVSIQNVGRFKGPIIKQNLTFQIWINIFIAVCRVHLLTLSGTYTNNVTGLTTPWSGALLLTTP